MTKYHAIKTTIAGITFSSKKEAHRYQELKLLERAGMITGLTLQPAWLLIVNEVNVGKYVGDFQYRDTATGKMILEDVKGVRTPVYRLKCKLMKAIYGIDILET